MQESFSLLKEAGTMMITESDVEFFKALADRLCDVLQLYQPGKLKENIRIPPDVLVNYQTWTFYDDAGL